MQVTEWKYCISLPRYDSLSNMVPTCPVFVGPVTVVRCISYNTQPHMYGQYYSSSTGMAGKDALDSAVLGGASDYFADIITQLRKLFTGPDEEKVSIGNLINIV